MKKLIGTGVALVTPLDAKHHVDFQGLEKLLAHVTASNVRYLVVHGTTGEASTTSWEEKKEILTFLRTHNASRLPVVCGISGNNTREVINTIEHTDFQGIDAVLTVSPYYNRPSQEGIYQHYKAVADACPVPLLLYNVPARTGATIEAATTLRLSGHPNIVGIKEASGNLLQCIAIAKDKPKSFLLISGEDMLTLPMMAIGASGAIATVANVFPQIMSEVVDFALRGEYASARTNALSLLQPTSFISQAGNPVGTKQLLAALHICHNYVRLPLITAPALLAREAELIVAAHSKK